MYDHAVVRVWLRFCHGGSRLQDSWFFKWPRGIKSQQARDTFTALTSNTRHATLLQRQVKTQDKRHSRAMETPSVAEATTRSKSKSLCKAPPRREPIARPMPKMPGAWSKSGARAFGMPRSPPPKAKAMPQHLALQHELLQSQQAVRQLLQEKEDEERLRQQKEQRQREFQEQQQQHLLAILQQQLQRRRCRLQLKHKQQELQLQAQQQQLQQQQRRLMELEKAGIASMHDHEQKWGHWGQCVFSFNCFPIPSGQKHRGERRAGGGQCKCSWLSTYFAGWRCKSVSIRYCI